VSDPRAETFAFSAQKTTYGGKDANVRFRTVTATRMLFIGRG
jgi:hypothetical protein